MTRHVEFRHESWALGGTFTISRGSKSAAEVVVAEIEEDGARGRGECVPYARYGESLHSVLDTLASCRAALERGFEREELQQRLTPGAARNAVDCALWDLAAKRAQRPVWQLAGLAPPVPVVTAYTLSLGSAAEMALAAGRHAARPLLKLKLDDRDPLHAVRAVRTRAPGARIIVDANESWSAGTLERRLTALAELGVELVEQPLGAGADEVLSKLDSPVAIAADESCHTRADLERVAERYRVVNIKLDKSGGLTEALRLRQAARELGLGIMVGCMVGTSLAMAPAALLTAGAKFVDLDGPLLLAGDREGGLDYDQAGRVGPPEPTLWG